MIFGIFGSLGAGKTILLVWLALKAKARGEEVYSNFGLIGSKDIDKVTDIRNLSNCLVLIDDIISWIDSRQSQSNIFVTHLLMASRKKRMNIGYTAQIVTGADLRLRYITDLTWLPYEIEFPIFGVEIRTGTPDQTDSEILTQFEITYGKDVYESYDTLEVAYQDIRKQEILDLLYTTKTKQLFVLLLNIRYSIMKTNGNALYDLIKSDIEEPIKQEFLVEILSREGFRLQ